MVNGLPTLDTPVRDILARWPLSETVLARRGLDLCCGGAHPLAMAARAHGQDPDEVLREILASLVSGGKP